MEAAMTSKGQATIPKAIRFAAFRPV